MDFMKIVAFLGNSESLKLSKELGTTHTINRKKIEILAGEIHKITGKGV